MHAYTYFINELDIFCFYIPVYGVCYIILVSHVQLSIISIEFQSSYWWDRHFMDREDDEDDRQSWRHCQPGVEYTYMCVSSSSRKPFFKPWKYPNNCFNQIFYLLLPPGRFLKCTPCMFTHTYNHYEINYSCATTPTKLRRHDGGTTLQNDTFSDASRSNETSCYKPDASSPFCLCTKRTTASIFVTTLVRHAKQNSDINHANLHYF